ncbi:aryl-alcohol dehydrogenase [Daedalea quercina L-15889]|uniref:Aryl-alcohol dehydrogenase n=1 Tax=Daedalea quercina L-15889 TaxID=1314783 RepID=A0A165S204_9APHY|nr:aryl-alcohol dehydrogenase [Daedalea quercina L-15889]
MTDFWAPPPAPKTRLGWHRQLAPLAGVHVSPICLGAMSIGDKWSSMGVMDKAQSFQLLDAFYDAGGNFIDTANLYQDGSSEDFLGEWMEERDLRDHIVIATKYTHNFRRSENYSQKTTFTGNNMKSLYLSVENSLKKLRTEYIDILYVHWWDWTCGVEEVMNGLHYLVQQRKVLYLGISNAPAWVVSEANTYARLTGKAPFVIYQGRWNVLDRDMEREIVPMCRAQGMAIAPWNVLAGGKIRTDEEEERRRQSGELGETTLSPQWERTPEQRQVCKTLEKVAEEVGVKSITAGTPTPFVFPLVGGRKIEHLMDNIKGLEISLSPEQIALIDSAKPFEPGFPYNIIGDGTVYSHQFKCGGHFDKWPVRQALRPH